MTHAPRPVLLRAVDIAAMLACSESKARLLMLDMPRIVTGRMVRVRAEALASYLREHEVQPWVPPSPGSSTAARRAAATSAPPKSELDSWSESIATHITQPRKRKGT